MKKLKILSVIIMIISCISNTIIPNIAFANFEMTQVELYSKGTYTDLIQYEGENYTVDYVVYSYNQNEYEAYSFIKGDEGISLTKTYPVNVMDIVDTTIWRIMYEGFPRRNATEMNCINNEEAYIATELAVVCIINNKNIDKFSGLNESGERIISVAKEIINKVSEKPYPCDISIKANKTDWEIDNINDNYASKTYNVICDNCEYEKVTLNLLENIPNNTIITDIKNQEKKEFNSGEEFKILIPVESLNTEGEFNIEALIEWKNYKVFQGNPTKSARTHYFLSTDSTETLNKTVNEKYAPINNKEENQQENNNSNEKEESASITNIRNNKYINNTYTTNNIQNTTNNNVTVNITEQKEEMYNKMLEEMKNIINLEMIDVNSIMAYINMINKENATYEAMIKENETSIEETKKENNIIHQKEETINNVKKLPRTGY